VGIRNHGAHIELFIPLFVSLYIIPITLSPFGTAKKDIKECMGPGIM
jgi:hypothetical protein